MARSLLKSKGRRGYSSYVALPHSILESTEWAELTTAEVKLLIDMFGQFNGRCNGALSSAWSLMKPRGWVSCDTLHRALNGLIEKGFLIKTRQGGRHVCSLFAVSWLPIQECDGKHDMAATTVASHAWKKR